jgi:nicotinamidase-related amidase
MQNFFLHPQIRPQATGGRKAHDNLCKNAIPACRKAGIDVIFLNWGLTEEDLTSMPASLRHNFSRSLTDPANGDGKGTVVGMGEDMGAVTQEDGTTIQAGKELMRDQWNTKLWGKLDEVWEEASKGGAYKDTTYWVHKNRASGLSIGSGISAMSTHLSDKARQPPTKTLLFAGVNTDQCVYGSFIDATTLGYDCILLEDCCATTSPEYATQASLFNCSRNGFVVDSSSLVEGAERFSA